MVWQRLFYVKIYSAGNDNFEALFPHFKREKTTNISIVASWRSSTWLGNNIPRFKCKKNYECFDPQRGQWTTISQASNAK